MAQKPVVMGPPKITRASKKNKKSWRVNIDVTEVEEGLGTIISFPVWLPNRLISAGLEPVFSHTEKSCIASNNR